MLVNEWLNENKLGMDIWKNKYQCENETFDEWLDRVTNKNESMKKLILDKKFLFGGRILSNRGLDKKGKKITLSNCFKEGCKIITKRGLINIEDVIVGDYVITEDGSWQKVNNVMCRDYIGDLYKISGSSLYDDIYCTPNHKFLTQEGWVRADRLLWKKPHKLKTPDLIYEKKYEKIDLLNILDSTDNFKIELLENGKLKVFKKCSKNRHNDNISWTSFGHEVNRYIELTSDFRYFIGRWLGDGSITRRKGNKNHSILQIVFNKEKEKEDALYCKKIGDKIFGFEGIYRETDQNIISLRWENEIVATWFYKEFGEKCDGKYLPSQYLGDLEIAKGLFDSDGFIGSHGRGRLVLKNKELIIWFRDTLYLNGYNTEKMKKDSRQKDTYETSFSVGTASKGFGKLIRKKYYDKTHGLITNDSLYKNYIHIDNIEIIENQNCKVYNLSVDNIHSYTVNGVVVHNCYVLPQVEDSIEGIYKTCSDLARTFSYGGGVGVDLSNLRPRGSIVNNTAKTTTGAVSFMETFSNVAETIGQNGRRAALMLSLDVSHPDIEEFVNIKTDLNKVTKANISVRITDDFMKAVENNENYVCKFFVEENKEEIKKEINARELFLKLCENNYNYAEPGILYWNRIEDYNLLQHDEEFEYAGVNPCAEECLPAGGSCLLGSFNLDAYVKNKEFNYTEFANDIFVVVEAMNEVLDEGLPLHPLEVQRQTVRDYRQIGIGVMGIADMLIHMECKYGSKESLEICDKIGKALADNVLRCSALLAKDHGKYPKYKESILESDFIKENASQTTLSLIKKYGLRNSQLLTIAPTGSLSTMLGISGGIEPIFENSYTRKTESLHNKDVYYKVYTPIVEEYIKEHDITEEELPDYFVTAMSLDALNRVQMQGVFQKHIDASISSTVNLPNEATIEDVYEIYVQAWKLGLKGVTIYRSGCKREGILTKNGNDNNNERELKRGEWEKKPDHIIEITRKLKSGCGKMTLHIGIIPEEKRIFEVYVTNSSRGGCVLNIQNLAITISNALRTGSNLQSLKKSYEGTGSCPSYATARAKNKKVSKGNSCGTSILYALLDVESDLKNDNLPELQKLGYYNTPKEKAEDQKVEKELTEQELIDMGLCPECQEPLIATGGCKQCSNCSWTKCE